MTDAPFTVWINDVDLRTLDCWVTRPGGLFASTETDSLQPLLGRAGAVVVNAEAVIEPRTFTLEFTLICSSASDAARRWRQVQDLFSGTVEFRAEPEPDHVLKVRAQRIADQPNGNLLKGWAATVEFTAPDPFWYDRVPCLYNLPAGVAVPLEPGTAPSAIALVLFGPGTDPTVDLLTPGGGGTGQQMVFTGVLADGDTWEIDPIQQEIVATVSEVRTSQPGLLTDGHYMVLDPRFATGDEAGWPACRITGCGGLAFVRRAWR